MHIRSKFDGGKQINRIQSGSWEGRCAGSGLHSNLGPSWGPQAWEKSIETPPDVFVAAGESAVHRCEKDGF